MTNDSHSIIIVGKIQDVCDPDFRCRSQGLLNQAILNLPANSARGRLQRNIRTFYLIHFIYIRKRYWYTKGKCLYTCLKRNELWKIVWSRLYLGVPPKNDQNWRNRILKYEMNSRIHTECLGQHSLSLYYYLQNLYKWNKISVTCLCSGCWRCGDSRRGAVFSNLQYILLN